MSILGILQLFGDTVSVITEIGRKEIEQRVADVGIKITNRSDLKVSKDESKFSKNLHRL